MLRIIPEFSPPLLTRQENKDIWVLLKSAVAKALSPHIFAA
jgi:hypothetical protein